MLDSSIWLESNHVRIVWITLLASMDEDGFAHYSAIENLANRARVSTEECADAVEILSSPDPNSGDPDNEGRRIERVAGGFVILNAKKYHEIHTRIIQREQTRLRVEKHRSKKATKKAPAQVFSEKEQKFVEEDPKEPKYHKDSRAALHYLNEKSGRDFREVDANLTIISARLREPDVTIEGVKQMISRQCILWNKPEMVEYLRPETLFGKQKFDSYYSARELPAIAPVDRQPRGPSISDLRTVLEAKKAERAKVFNRGHENALGWTPANEEDRKLMSSLNKEVADLMHKISIQKV